MPGHISKLASQESLSHPHDYRTSNHHHIRLPDIRGLCHLDLEEISSDFYIIRLRPRILIILRRLSGSQNTAAPDRTALHGNRSTSM